MKRLMIAGLTTGFCMAVSAVTVDVVSGYAETKTLGDYEFLIVKSNSTLRVGGRPGTVDVLAVGGGGGGAAGYGGGGGGYGENCGAGGAGGSGVVIIRYHLKKKGFALIVR